MLADFSRLELIVIGLTLVAAAVAVVILNLTSANPTIAALTILLILVAGGIAGASALARSLHR